MSKTHDLRTQPREDRLYGIHFSTRLIVAGSENRVGYGIGMVPTGSAGRQVDSGPQVPGPWGYVYGLSAVIDNHGGSAREIAREEAEGRVVRCEAGDRLILSDDLTVEVQLTPRRYPELVEVKGAQAPVTTQLTLLLTHEEVTTLLAALSAYGSQRPERRDVTNRLEEFVLLSLPR